MNAEAVTIILPLPPSVLSPNRPPATPGGRMARAAAAKKYKRLAREAAEDEEIATAPWAMATIQSAFFHKQKRRRDDVNHLAMLKAAYDGLVEAGLLKDDDSEHLTTLPATFDVDRKCSRVELTVTRATDNRLWFLNERKEEIVLFVKNGDRMWEYHDWAWHDHRWHLYGLSMQEAVCFGYPQITEQQARDHLPEEAFGEALHKVDTFSLP